MTQDEFDGLLMAALHGPRAQAITTRLIEIIIADGFPPAMLDAVGDLVARVDRLELVSALESTLTRLWHDGRSNDGLAARRTVSLAVARQAIEESVLDWSKKANAPEIAEILGEP